jgi:NAD(P)-dependent dehydrogenase (short-subunit alcohol dehydrogenase family)
MEEIAVNPPIYYPEPPKLRGKSVLVVGGTIGVGEAVARRCLSGGAVVTVIGLERNDGLPCEQVIFDVALDPEKSEQYFIGREFVFNNIGMIARNRIKSTPLNQVRQFLRVNVETMFLLTKYSLRHILEVAVNMGSRPVFREYADWSLYAMTKHTIADLTKSAAEEGTQKFYTFSPSRMDTKFRDSVYPDEDKATRLSPEKAAEFIVTLFNGKNPSGTEYWMRRVYEKSINSRHI